MHRPSSRHAHAKCRSSGSGEARAVVCGVVAAPSSKSSVRGTGSRGLVLRGFIPRDFGLASSDISVAAAAAVASTAASPATSSAVSIFSSLSAGAILYFLRDGARGARVALRRLLRALPLGGGKLLLIFYCPPTESSDQKPSVVGHARRVPARWSCGLSVFVEMSHVPRHTCHAWYATVALSAATVVTAQGDTTSHWDHNYEPGAFAVRSHSQMSSECLPWRPRAGLSQCRRLRRCVAARRVAL